MLCRRSASLFDIPQGTRSVHIAFPCGAWERENPFFLCALCASSVFLV